MSWKWPTVWEGEHGGWWRVPTTLVLWLGGYFLGVVIVTAIMIGLKSTLATQPEHLKEIVSSLVGAPIQIGLMLAGCLVGVRFVHRKPIASVVTDGRPFRVGLGFQSAGLWILLWFAGTGCLPGGWQHLVTRAGEVPTAWQPVLVVVSLCAIAFQASQEEIVFRGYLLTRVAAWVKRPWLAVGITSIVFAAVHLHASPAAKAAIVMFAIAFSAACVRAGTLSASIGLHTAQNSMQSIWYPKSTNADATWIEAVVLAVQLVIWFGWLLWATRRIHHESRVEPIPPETGS